MTDLIERGMSLKKALRLGRELGLDIYYANRTGEWVIENPFNGRTTKHNARRRDASVQFVSILRRVKERFHAR